MNGFFKSKMGWAIITLLLFFVFYAFNAPNYAYAPLVLYLLYFWGSSMYNVIFKKKR